MDIDEEKFTGEAAEGFDPFALPKRRSDDDDEDLPLLDDEDILPLDDDLLGEAAGFDSLDPNY